MVFGLNSAANAVTAQACENGTLKAANAIDGSFITKAPMTIFITGEGMMGKTSTTTDKDGAVLFKTATKMTGTSLVSTRRLWIIPCCPPCSLPCLLTNPCTAHPQA